MDDYRRALSAYLDPKERTQEELASQAGCTQVTISRYLNGTRFPDAETARRIDEATRGAVSFATWVRVATERLLGEAA